MANIDVSKGLTPTWHTEIFQIPFMLTSPEKMPPHSHHYSDTVGEGHGHPLQIHISRAEKHFSFFVMPVAAVEHAHPRIKSRAPHLD
jgi:hypothetical protein